MANTGPFSFAQQQSLAKGVSAAASVTNLPILNQLDVLMKTLTDSAQRQFLFTSPLFFYFLFTVIFFRPFAFQIYSTSFQAMI